MIIAVVDDTMQDRELLKGMLDQYFSGHQTVPEIQEFESGEAFLEAYEPGHYDIIFFDIYMSMNIRISHQNIHKTREYSENQ